MPTKDRRSGAAHSLLNRLSTLTFKSLAPIISIWEKNRIRLLMRPKPGEPFARDPIFIVGAPRTGSTILYQALTNYFQISYIDNLTCRLHRNLYFGFWLSRYLYCMRPHNNFTSEYGDTSKHGLHSPSECGEFWYRWLPTDRHFIDHSDIPASTVREIYEEIIAISCRFGAPVLFKNLNAGQRLRLIHRCFPNARIIHIRRNPDKVVESILKARKQFSIQPDQWWSIMPRNHQQLLNLPERDMVKAQVEHIEKQIKEDRQLFPDENYRLVEFEKLDKSLITELGAWLQLPLRKGGSLPQLDLSAK